MGFSPVISNDNTAQWIIAIATVFLGIATFLAVWVALFKENIRKPIIKIQFGNEKPYVIDSYPNGTINLLFRLKIVNQGKTIAKNCRVKIISVIPENGSIENSLIEEPDILKWSSAPRDMRYRIDPGIDIGSVDKTQLTPTHREHKDVTPKGGWEFCDLFKINSREKRVIFISSGERDFLPEKGKSYIATIEISGDNLKPTKKEIKFSVPDRVDWTNSTNPILHLAQIDGVRGIS